MNFKTYTLIFALLFSIHAKCQDFIVRLNDASFRFEEKVKKGSLSQIARGNHYYIYDQWFLDIDLDVDNLSNEDIEEALLVVYFTAHFANGSTRTVGPLTDKMLIPVWRKNETTFFIKKFRLELNEYFNKGMMLHIPTKVYLDVYLEASNSIGYSVSSVPLIKNRIIPSW